MNDSLLLELATNLGYYLAMSGAETYRVEESIVRVLGAYGYEAEAFAIPNCLTVSMISPDGTKKCVSKRGSFMNDSLLLELATNLGYYLAMSGAETYRVEESIVRVLGAYGYEAEAFAIPNCLTVSMISPDGTPMTRMRRIGIHGNDLDAVERYSNLSRRICADPPEPQVAMDWLRQTKANCLHFRWWGKACGYFFGAFGFCFFYGGDPADAVGSGLCGLLIFAIDLWMDRLRSTQFFRTIFSAFFSAILAYTLHGFGLIRSADAAIIGALMLLVPGLLFTNAMRDIMYGDTNSGINRIVQVLLIAVAIALGTAGALNLAHVFWLDPNGTEAVSLSPLIQNMGSFIGAVGFAIYFNIHGPGGLLCALGSVLAWSTYLITIHFTDNVIWANFTGAMVGFAIYFNIHGPGGLLCALGSVLAWSTYLITIHFTDNVIWANFTGAMVASLYAETMARIRKYPAISYLVVSIFPLIPGAGVYYTMTYAVQGQMDRFANNGMLTAAIAGAIALGILLVSSAFRLATAKRRSIRK